MGGMGSGRWHRRTPRLTTGHCVAIDLAAIGRLHANFPQRIANSPDRPLVGISQSPSLDVVVVEAITSTDARRFEVQLSKTCPRFGGVRFWFTCPRCAHRRRVLHLTPSLALGCYECLGLAYSTQRMNRYWRLNHRLDRLWARLGGTAETFGRRYWPRRPKGRRRATQQRFKAEYEALNAAIWGEGMKRLEGLLATHSR